jgi:hypothetical protein
MQDSHSGYGYGHSNGSGHGSGYGGSTDPFADQNAIPLQPNKTKHDAFASANSLNDPEQPFPRYDQQKDRAPSRQKGWFKGKITYAVYLLTLVQLAVFIAEIVKNGKTGERASVAASRLTDCSNINRLANRDTSDVQSHDRTVAASSHQHGGQICAVYAPVRPPE